MKAKTLFDRIVMSMILSIILVLTLERSSAQRALLSNDTSLEIYRETPPRINDLVHTRLDVRFDYKKRYLYGKEWLTLKPHFYPTDTLSLDAKGMDINSVSREKNGRHLPLKFTYDGWILHIQLDKVYHPGEDYTIYINYTAKPDELNVQGSVAIGGAKGLYFINPDGTDKAKPTQIWTQGETESSSAWFPTIDEPQQKSTAEIMMTIPEKYVSLSNGRLAAQKKNGDGTRTDTWKMDLPHSPYLFMMAVGDFSIYHDKWRDKEVNYYLEPKYAPYAKLIFGMTPEMMEFYSELLGVDFPWNKYSQIVVRDYVSGAMENTSATLHGDFVQRTPRELVDVYYDFGQQTVAHELFHQWFGDLVTCESWSNLTLNESFANLGEMLWAEHKYGADAAADLNYQQMQLYLRNPEARTKPLVRFHYKDREDIIDVVTYQKGGRILSMLRNYLGDAAFFKGLSLYLKRNAFKTGEAHQLRLALEEVSGLDLNWFFNQWYYGSGHPVLNINYEWDEQLKTQKVFLRQTQEGRIFNLPIAVDVYAGGKRQRYNIWMNSKTDTLFFRETSQPDLINVDAGKVLLAEKNDAKTIGEYKFQYFNAPLYTDRFEAISAAAALQTDSNGQQVMIAALRDKYYGLRKKAIDALDMNNPRIRDAALPILASLAQTDENTLVQAAAIGVLGKLKMSENMAMFRHALASRSYAVQGAALAAISLLDSMQGLALAKTFENDNKGALAEAIMRVYGLYGDSGQWQFLYRAFREAPPQAKFNVMRSFAAMVGRVDNVDYAKEGIDVMKTLGIQYSQSVPGAGPYICGLLKGIKSSRTKINDDISSKSADDAVKEIEAVMKPKGL